MGHAEPDLISLDDPVALVGVKTGRLQWSTWPDGAGLSAEVTEDQGSRLWAGVQPHDGGGWRWGVTRVAGEEEQEELASGWARDLGASVQAAAAAVEEIVYPAASSLDPV